MAKNGRLISVVNHRLGTAYRVNIPANGLISARVRRLCAVTLGTPPGYRDPETDEPAGPLGEVGEQCPPETPGWRYTFEALEGGRVRATPHAIEKARPRRRRNRSQHA